MVRSAFDLSEMPTGNSAVSVNLFLGEGPSRALGSGVSIMLVSAHLRDQDSSSADKGVLSLLGTAVVGLGTS